MKMNASPNILNTIIPKTNIILVFAEYKILGKKGEGTFSEVLKCQHIQDGTYFACKKMKQTYDRWVFGD